MSESSNKFIGRNRKPRVHIEYEVELDGAMKKVTLPFVMGVMANLSGKNNSELPSIEKRNFVEFDHENFDKNLRQMKPRVAFQVDNKLGGENTGEKIGVDITFESMEDFSPDRVARKVGALSNLLDMRQQLDQLLALAAGREKAEAKLNHLIEQLRNDPQFKKALSEPAK